MALIRGFALPAGVQANVGVSNKVEIGQATQSLGLMTQDDWGAVHANAPKSPFGGHASVKILSEDEDPMNCSCIAPPEDEGEPLTDSDREVLRDGKIGVIFATFVLTLFAAALPWVVVRYLRHAMYWLALGAAAAAGIIIGAFLSHLTPDANEAFTSFFEQEGPVGLLKPEHAEYPFAQLLIGVSLVLLIFIDAVFISRGIDGDGGAHSHGHGNQKATSSSSGHSHMLPAIPESFSGSADDCHQVALETTTDTSTNGEVDKSVALSPDQNPDSQRGSKKQVANAYLFFIALSLHSIFDGLSIGAEQEISGFYSLLIAVLGHKFFDGFALGVPVYFAKLPVQHTIFALVFTSAMTPLGIGIGWAATSAGNTSASQLLAEAIILSLSAGSFLFISLIELLPAALANGKNPWLKCAVFTLGWGLMALIALWV